MRGIALASLIGLSATNALAQTAAPPGTPIAPVAPVAPDAPAPPPEPTPPPPPPPSEQPPPPPPGPPPPPPGAQPPPGQPYPPGSYPPGAYPPGSYPPGSYPPGSYPPGAYPPGSHPPGQYPPPPGYYYPQPGYAYPPGSAYPPPGEQPPAPKKPDTSKRNHDGFYLRMGMGPGYGRVVAEGAGSNDVKATYKGWGPAFELLLGGTLGSGFVLGGGFVGQDVSEPDLEVESRSVNVSGTVEDQSLGILTIGPFIDWYPDPKGGAHVGVMIGPAEVGLQDDDGQSSTGLGGSLFGGYDFWIGDQWSLGLEGRVVAASTEHTRNDASFDNAAMSYQVLFTALLH